MLPKSFILSNKAKVSYTSDTLINSGESEWTWVNFSVSKLKYKSNSLRLPASPDTQPKKADSRCLPSNTKYDGRIVASLTSSVKISFMGISVSGCHNKIDPIGYPRQILSKNSSTCLNDHTKSRWNIGTAYSSFTILSKTSRKNSRSDLILILDFIITASNKFHKFQQE